MPYEPHSDLLQPEDVNAYIWRFISLPKFLDMLVTRSLYFVRGDQSDDPYDGMPPDDYMDSVRNRRSNFENVGRAVRTFHFYRCSYFVNCWHLSPHESAGMWKLYAGVDAGIAIKSSYSRLMHAYQHKPERFYLGLTSYESKYVFGPMNTFKFVMHKRPAFGHEKEVRALVWKPREDDFSVYNDESATSLLPCLPGPLGIHMDTELSALIMEVVVSPTSPPYLVEVLRDVVKRYGYKFDIRQSTLTKLSYVDYGHS